MTDRLDPNRNAVYPLGDVFDHSGVSCESLFGHAAFRVKLAARTSFSCAS